MAPLSALVTCTLDNSGTGIPADDVVVSFAIGLDGTFDIADVAAEVLTPVTRFFNQENGAGHAVIEFFSSEISRAASAHTLRIYDLDGHLNGSPHGSPIYETPFTTALVALAGSSPLPAEVAACLTLRGFNWAAQPVERPDGADPGAAVDRPRQRYSGRMFLGPLNTAAMVTAGGVARPAGIFEACVLDAAERLHDDLDVFGHAWSVWSRVDAGLRAITHAEFDNAWDTQRRRGNRPTGRTTRVLEP